MAISRINNPSIDNMRSVLQATDPALQTDSPSFQDILNKTNGELQRVSLQDKSPLSKTQIADIINYISIQMNNRLMQALSSDTKEEIDVRYTGLFDRFILPDMKSSKNYQANQNNDVFMVQEDVEPVIFEVREDLEPIITEAAKAYGVEPALIKSVIRVESNFNPNSTSPKGAMGLMQLMPATAKDLGVYNAYDPVENVRAGTRYLKALLNRYDGNVNLALAAYNWGMGNLEKRPERMPAETKNYVANVIRHYEQAKT